MTSCKRIVLMCALFLCAPADPAVPPVGFCVRSRCFAVFQTPVDYWSAHDRCRNMDALLLESDPRVVQPLLGADAGFYWVADPRRPAEDDPPPDGCSSVTANGTRTVSVADRPCAHPLDGFVCQLTFRDSCPRLQVRAPSQVTFTTPLGFPETRLFPRGTVAVARTADAPFPDSRHVCFGGRWLRAPWNCEVLGGGCDHRCGSDPRRCLCPPGTVLHRNNVSCAEDPCVRCAHRCVPEDGAYRCGCDKGYRLGPDRSGCVDVDECAEEACAEHGQRCVNTEGGFECRCAEDFHMENGRCVNMSICMKCEHVCAPVRGVYECVCREGFRVSRTDPTRCDAHCAEEECAAHCVPDPDRERKDTLQCFCPDGFIHETRNGSALCVDIDECDMRTTCEHVCHNHYGGFRCACRDGFDLYDAHRCRPAEPAPVPPGPARARPTALPSYVKTGSVLGMTVFVGACAGLLYLLVDRSFRRCTRTQLYSVKPRDADAVSLQQVSTERYRRLSTDTDGH